RLLHQRMTQRGATFTAAGLALALAQEATAAKAIPSALLSRTGRTVMGAIARKLAVPGTNAGILAAPVLGSMAWMKWVQVGVLVAAVGLVAFLGMGSGTRHRDGKPTTFDAAPIIQDARFNHVQAVSTYVLPGANPYALYYNDGVRPYIYGRLINDMV